MPERFGGPGGGPEEVAAAIEQVAGACTSTGMVYVMHVVAVQTLAAGTGEGEPEGPKAAPFDGLGMRGNASAPLRVRGLRVVDERRLGAPGAGFGLMMSATLPWFVLGSAACSVGIAGAALAAAVEHAGGSRFEHLGSTLADVAGGAGAAGGGQDPPRAGPRVPATSVRDARGHFDQEGARWARPPGSSLSPHSRWRRR